MSWLSDFFTSPRERAAPGLWQEQQKSYNDLIGQTKNLTSPYAGVNAGNVYSKFGVTQFDPAAYKTQVKGAYTPLYQNLATAMAKLKSNASARMGAGEATPEARFAPIDSGYFEQLGNLGSQEAQQELQGQNIQTQQQEFMAGLLNSIYGNQQGFDLGKLNTEAGLTQAKGGAMAQYLNSLSDTSTFGDVMSGLSTAAQVAAIPLTGGASLGPTVAGWFGNTLKKGINWLGGGPSASDKLLAATEAHGG